MLLGLFAVSVLVGKRPTHFCLALPLLVPLTATATRPIFTEGLGYEPFLLAGQITLSALKGLWVRNALETNGASPMAMPKA